MKVCGAYCRDDAWRKAMWAALSTCPDVNRSQQKAVLAAAFSTLTLWQVSNSIDLGHACYSKVSCTFNSLLMIVRYIRAVSIYRGHQARVKHGRC